MSAPLQRIAHLLVTPENPPRNDVDGMDSERCAALHNAIFEHGWIHSGRTAESFQDQTETMLEHLDPEERERLHPSLQAFLGEARVLSGNIQDMNFFYNVHGLSLSWEKECVYDPDPNRLLTLYGTHMAMATNIDGLVYDQHVHKAIMHFDITDDLELDPNQPWRKLEDILSVWIEMVQRSKIRSVPSASTDMAPWEAATWTTKDLEECIEVWGMIVETIEQKMSLGATEADAGLLDVATLDTAQVPDGFVRKFVLQARKPRFKFIAPGLRVPTAEEFTIQPFTYVPRSDRSSPEEIPPILLFRSDETIRTAELFWFFYPYAGSAALVQECPCGLYFDHCDPMLPTPFEDGCRLVLPFKLESGFAKQGDFSKVEGFDTILQQGLNSYNMRHPLPFQAWLETIYSNVEDGTWAVDTHGVAGGLEVWKKADTEEGWQDYHVPLGPGRYW